MQELGKHCISRPILYVLTRGMFCTCCNCGARCSVRGHCLGSSVHQAEFQCCGFAQPRYNSTPAQDYEGFITPDDVAEAVTLGDDVSVKIMSIDTDRNSFTCSIREGDSVKAAEYGDKFRQLNEQRKQEREAARLAE